MNRGKPKIIAKELSAFTSHDKRLFDQLSFQIEAGEFVLITGPNGAGKSTLVKILAGELRAQCGSLHVDSDRIGYLPQLQNRTFHLPLSLADVSAFDQVHKRFSESAVSLLTQEELHLSWNSASGGERQKALLTKLLNSDWDLLLLDEPFNHLDASTRQKLLHVLNVATGQLRKSVVMVCHDPPSLELPIQASQTIQIGTATKND